MLLYGCTRGSWFRQHHAGTHTLDTRNSQTHTCAAGGGLQELTHFPSWATLAVLEVEGGRDLDDATAELLANVAQLPQGSRERALVEGVQELQMVGVVPHSHLCNHAPSIANTAVCNVCERMCLRISTCAVASFIVHGQPWLYVCTPFSCRHG